MGQATTSGRIPKKKVYDTGGAGGGVFGDEGQAKKRVSRPPNKVLHGILWLRDAACVLLMASVGQW